MRFFVLLIILLSLFGPKFGLIDVSIFGGVLGLIILACTRRKVQVPREYMIFVSLVAAVFLYTIVVYVFSGCDDEYVLLRYARALLSTVMLGLVFSNIRVRSSQLFNIFILGLLFNACVILFQVVLPKLQIYLAPIWGFNKHIVPFRAFGLTPGYDGAGYLCLLGAILSAFGVWYSSKAVRYLLALWLFVLSASFTTRTNIILMFFVIIVITFLFLLKGKRLLKILAISNIIIGGLLIIKYIVPIFVATVPFLMEHEIFSTINTDVRYTESYYSGTPDNWKDMWILPDDEWDILFGSGFNPSTDIGYIKVIFMIGITGLLISTFTYLYIFLRSINTYIILSRCRHTYDYLTAKALVLTLLIFIASFIVLNFKSLTFHSRTYHEIVVILFFHVLRNTKRIIIRHNHDIL